MQWNMMGRSSMVSGLMLQHISWHDDCLVVTTPKHKGDQEGAHCYPRHIFANPLQPFICPVLSLAILIFSRSYRGDDPTNSFIPFSPLCRSFPASGAI